MNIKWRSLIGGILLLLAIPSGWPYDYYTMLRWVVCGVAIFNSVAFYNSKLIGWVWVFGAIALLFNPLFPVYMNKSFWIAIDLVGAVIFFLSAYYNKKTNEKN